MGHEGESQEEENTFLEGANKKSLPIQQAFC
jgi:hypothetical protein